MRTQHLITLALLGVGALACERDPIIPAEHVEDPVTLDPSQSARESSLAAAGDTKAATKSLNDHREAEADFQSAEGVQLKGEAELKETDAGLLIKVEVKSAPVGLKGIHVHEKGDCSDIRGKSMGGHFTPGTEAHGLPEGQTKHLGDLGNIKIDADGNGKLKIVVAEANLKPGDAYSFLGKAMVIHTAEDVGTGDSGESGDPIACALIEKD